MNTQAIKSETLGVEFDGFDLSLEELELLVDGDEQEEVESEFAALSRELSSLTIKDDSDIEDIVEDVPEDTIYDDVDDGLLKQAMKLVEVKEVAEQAYEEQGEAVKDDFRVVEKEEKKAEKKEKKTPRATRYTHSREELLKVKARPDFYLLEKSDLDLDEEGQKAKHDEVNAMIKGMNVKIGAKCINLLSSLNGSAKLSTFIEQGLRYVIDHESITKQDMMDYYMNKSRNGVKSYDKSTATPQSSTILRLFVDLRVLNLNAGVYSLNENSLILDSFMSKRGGASE